MWIRFTWVIIILLIAITYILGTIINLWIAYLNIFLLGFYFFNLLLLSLLIRNNCRLFSQSLRFKHLLHLIYFRLSLFLLYFFLFLYFLDMMLFMLILVFNLWNLPIALILKEIPFENTLEYEIVNLFLIIKILQFNIVINLLVTQNISKVFVSWLTHSFPGLDPNIPNIFEDFSVIENILFI